MREEQVLNWINSQHKNLDLIIYQAGYNYFIANKDKENFAFDLAECQSESFNLINNKDLCYDRPATGFVYSLWYHARRLNTFLRFFTKAILNSNDDLIEIFDLGAGTGAVQFAAGLVCCAMKSLGYQPPKIKIINVDTSPIMLSYNRDYLWKEFNNYYQVSSANNDFQVEYSVNSWNVKTEQQAINPWITASYLFDMSDNKDLIAKDFIDLINHYKPTTLLLLTSNQSAKVQMLNSVLLQVKTLNYDIQNISETALLFKGELTNVNKLRVYLSQNFSGRGLNSLTSWNDSSFIGTVLRRRTNELNLITPSKEIASIDLFLPKIKVRRDIKLSDQQKEASVFIGRPSIIIGPAGSGKSVVISEKIKYIVEKANYEPNLKILVTTFNKGLISKLGDWLEELLDPKFFTRVKDKNYQGYEDEASSFYFANSTSPNIRLLNFDLLPTRLSNIRGTLKFDSDLLRILEKCIEQVKNEENINHNRFDNILKSDFILEEYHRIFYGMHIRSREEYLGVTRSGRWQGLNQERREIVYKCVSKYMNHIAKNNIHSITTRRRFLLNQLNNNELQIKYDFILVDEFQDCTKADFDIFFKLIKDVNNLTFAGDLAQAIHIGKSADIPRDENMRYRKRFLLEGSYRLPQRISECISELSKTIVKRWKENEGANSIAPVKSSPPGSRPIVVFAQDLPSITNKIKAIFETYKIYDLTKVTILEKDKELSKSLSESNIPSETDTILRLKGLEKDCILWSTRVDIEDEKETYEFIYTILTRTSCILIIALSNSTKDNFKKVINLLNKEKLIIWDQETREKYNSFCEQVDLEIIRTEVE